MECSTRSHCPVNQQTSKAVIFRSSGTSVVNCVQKAHELAGGLILIDSSFICLSLSQSLANVVDQFEIFYIDT